MRISFFHVNGTQAVTPWEFWLPAVGSPGQILKAKLGKLFRQATATNTILPSTPTEKSSRTMQTWNGIWDHRGIDQRGSCMPPVEVNLAGEAELENGQSTTLIVCQPSSMLDQVHQ